MWFILTHKLHLSSISSFSFPSLYPSIFQDLIQLLFSHINMFIIPHLTSVSLQHVVETTSTVVMHFYFLYYCLEPWFKPCLDLQVFRLISWTKAVNFSKESGKIFGIATSLKGLSAVQYINLELLTVPQLLYFVSHLFCYVI